MKIFGYEIKKPSKPMIQEIPPDTSKILPTLANPWEIGFNREVYTQEDFYALVNTYKSWVYICANKNATSVAEVPLRLYVTKPKKESKILVKSHKITKEKFSILESRGNLSKYTTKGLDGIEEVEDHQFLSMLRNVNPLINRFDLWEATELWLELTGNAYWYVWKDALGVPQQIWPLPPQFVRIVVDKEKIIGGYIFQRAIEKVPFEADEVIHFRFSNPTGSLYGSGPLAAIMDTYVTDRNIRTFEKTLMKNMGRPEGVLETTDSISQETFKRLREEWNKNYAGVSKVGKTLILENGLKYKPITFTPREMNYIVGRKMNREEIAAAFGVPISKLTTDSVNRCHDEITEILTNNGWKRYDEVLDIDKIATCNTENNTLEYYVPNERFVYRYDGEMLLWQNNSLDMCVTPNHMMWISCQSHGNKWTPFKMVEADRVPKNFAQIQTINWAGGKYIDQIRISDKDFDTNKFIEAIGYMISDPEIDYSKDFSELKLDQEYIHQWFMQEIGDSVDTLKIPRWMLNLPRDQLMILFRAIMKSGYYDPREGRTSGYHLFISEQLANDFMELAFKLGYRTYKQTHNERKYQVYFVIAGVWGTTLFQYCQSQVQIIPYEGIVWSFDVPNHCYITRRNGKVGINGNSNAEQGNYQYHIDTVEPRLRRLEEKINERLMPMYDENLFVAYDSTVLDDRDFELMKRESNLKSYLTTINEERKRIGYTPVPWGETPLVPIGTVPLPTGNNQFPTGLPENQPPDDTIVPQEEIEEDEKNLEKFTEKVLNRVKIRLKEMSKDDWIEAWQENPHWDKKKASPLVHKLLKSYGKDSNEITVLEIGCGNGVDSIEFGKSGAKVIGIDVSQEAVKLAKKNNDLKNVKFQVGDAENLTFEDAQFDLVYSLAVLHSTDLKKSIPELSRVLKSEGQSLLFLYQKTLHTIGEDERDFKIGEIEKIFKKENLSIKDKWKGTTKDNDTEGDKHQHYWIVYILEKKDNG